MAPDTKTAEGKRHAPSPSAKGWMIDLLMGGLGGGLAGAIVAVNIVIFSGIDDGYESSFGDVMDFNRFLGLTVLAVLLAAPISAISILRRLRRNRTRPCIV